MKKCIFLDRDGVICKSIDGFFHKKEQFIICPRAAEAICNLNKCGYVVVVVTNQPVVARGLCTILQLEEIHTHMRNLLAEKGAWLDAIYYCPHHPIAGDNSEYTRECECRKPKPGLILRAQKELGIPDLTESFIVGDSISDIKAGRDAGCKTILIERDSPDLWNDAVPDFKARDLYDAVTTIIL